MMLSSQKSLVVLAVVSILWGRIFGLDDISDFRQIASQYHHELPMDVVLQFYDSLGPQLMLDTLDQMGHCHDMGHNIGKQVLIRVSFLMVNCY